MTVNRNKSLLTNIFNLYLLLSVSVDTVIYQHLFWGKKKIHFNHQIKIVTAPCNLFWINFALHMKGLSAVLHLQYYCLAADMLTEGWPFISR